VRRLWEPRRLTTLWTSTACYRGSFAFAGCLGRISCIHFRVLTAWSVSVPCSSELDLTTRDYLSRWPDRSTGTTGAESPQSASRGVDQKVKLIHVGFVVDIVSLGQLSQYSDRIDRPAGAKFFPLSISSTPFLGPTQPPVYGYRGLLLQGLCGKC
jgi:hypothetical protein